MKTHLTRLLLTGCVSLTAACSSSGFASSDCTSDDTCRVAFGADYRCVAGTCQAGEGSADTGAAADTTDDDSASDTSNQTDSAADDSESADTETDSDTAAEDTGDVTPDSDTGTDAETDTGTDTDACTPELLYRDGDGDEFGEGSGESRCPESGWVATPGDCNDAVASINPGAEEAVGDNVDSDCDGEEICFSDADFDGHRPLESGTVISPDATCSTANGEAGLEAPADDCNDAVASIHPDAEETVGDNVDSDCDGEEICFADADSDGHRPPESSTVTSPDETCSTANGEAVLETPADDCDDAHATVYPGAAALCTDGLSNSCDPLDDLSCRYAGTTSPGLTADNIVLVGTEPNGDFGARILVADLNGDGQADLAVSDPKRDVVTLEGDVADAGAVYVFFGPLGTGCYSDAEADVTLTGTDPTGYAGTAFLLGEVNGDTTPDLIVGVPGGVSRDGTTGVVTWTPGPLTGDSRLADTPIAAGTSTSRNVGASLANLGDADGNGFDEIAVGQPDTTGVGHVSVFEFDATGPDALVRDYRGEGSGDGFGTALEAADVDASGRKELIISSPNQVIAGTARGAVGIFRNPADTGGGSGGPPVGAVVELQGPTGTTAAPGSSLATADVNHDGFDDILIGAPRMNGSNGAAYIVRGSSAFLSGGVQRLPASLTATMTGSGTFAGVGTQVFGLSDLDGDSFAESGIYAVQSDGSGRFLILYGSALPDSTFSSTSTGAAVLSGTTDLGAGAGAGDLDGDGVPDIALGSPGGGASGLCGGVSGAGLVVVVPHAR